MHRRSQKRCHFVTTPTFWSWSLRIYLYAGYLTTLTASQATQRRLRFTNIHIVTYYYDGQKNPAYIQDRMSNE